MGLELNELMPYKEYAYPVNTVDQMPILRGEGRTPLSVRDLMERRLNSQLPDWKNNYFFLGDAIAYSLKNERYESLRRLSMGGGSFCLKPAFASFNPRVDGGILPV